jgi:hypothetical protein
VEAIVGVELAQWNGLAQALNRAETDLGANRIRLATS